jgi:hypothetical protein
MSINSVNYIKNSVKMDNIKNTVRCYITDNPLRLDIIQESVRNQDLRKKLIKMGEDDALTFLSDKKENDNS